MLSFDIIIFWNLLVASFLFVRLSLGSSHKINNLMSKVLKILWRPKSNYYNGHYKCFFLQCHCKKNYVAVSRQFNPIWKILLMLGSSNWTPANMQQKRQFDLLKAIPQSHFAWSWWVGQRENCVRGKFPIRCCRYQGGGEVMIWLAIK